MGSRKLATSIDEVLDLSWSDASEGEDTYGNDDDDNANIDSSLALSEVSSSGGAKSDQHHHHPCKMTEVKAIEHMAKTETQSLRLWRFVLFGILLVAGSIVSIGTHRYLSSQERQEAMESFKLFKKTVQSASEKQVADFNLAMTVMAETITIAGLNSPRTFPFVRVPMYEASGAHARQLSGVEFVAWSPLVEQANRDDWAEFVDQERSWYEESQQLASFRANAVYDGNSTLIRPFIWHGNRSKDGNIEVVPKQSNDTPLYPIWQCSPPPHSPLYVNFDMATELYIPQLLPGMQDRRFGSMTACHSSFATLPDALSGEGFQDDFHSGLLDTADFDDGDHPHAMFVQPVYAGLNSNGSKMVGFLSSIVAFDAFATNLLPDGVNGITAVLSNTCGQHYTYQLHGREAVLLGKGDLHDDRYRDTNSTFRLEIAPKRNETASHAECMYNMTLYYSDEYKCASGNQVEEILALAMAAVFGLMATVFCAYDRLVIRRNAKIVDAAARSNGIISSLFPKQVRDRLFAESETREPSNQKNKLKAASNHMAGDGDDDVDDSVFKTQPIADLFPDTTVLFADIAGFTSWSSVREPCQVFKLLETLFHAFDEIARKRRVFKVETVGDCYVAVTGLPETRKDHAVAMARFARDCMHRTQVLLPKLEVTLGPDTADLAMRMGMHSGPVTAGVLRGARSRFQLFGDTMNTAARMESTGLRCKIQISQETADLLVAAGKTSWIRQREDVVVAKGKGELRTYWLAVHSTNGDSSTKDSTSESLGAIEEGNVRADPRLINDKTLRLIKWNVELLCRLLKHVVAQRNVEATATPLSKRVLALESHFCGASGSNPFGEVEESIKLPRFGSAGRVHQDPASVVLDPAVEQQLFDYVSAIATMYRDNPFHNFAHASHVAMSVSKLLSRIAAPSETESGKAMDFSLHDYAYGISSDPLTHFSCVISALIHDVEHPGVPNAQLVRENAPLAETYDGQSVAEQHSVTLSWNLLQDAKYAALRRTIYTTHDELLRFRQIVVNAVMATDIVDKNLKLLRNLRWDRAFSPSLTMSVHGHDMMDRKATIVIEHLIQASDVAHTMQHWHVYRKWNELFFLECYQAFADGRADHDPLDGWYDGELGFFDHYIIPLAKKLKDCGVFGVSCDEYLNYALQNRREWEKRGKEVINEMRELVGGKKVVSTGNSASARYFI